MEPKPNHIPPLVEQALAWLEKMNIAYCYIPESEFWEFKYDGLYMFIVNAPDGNFLEICAPVFITDSDDVEIQDMVYECSEPVIEMEFSSMSHYGYDGHGMCHILQLISPQNPKSRLTKTFFVGKLKEIHELQFKLHDILHCTYEGMFNPPAEVMREILKDVHKSDENDD